MPSCILCLTLLAQPVPEQAGVVGFLSVLLIRLRSLSPAGGRRCHNRIVIPIVVIPAKAGIQNLLIILDSPVSSTGQAHRRASLEFIRRMLDGMTKKVIATQSPGVGDGAEADALNATWYYLTLFKRTGSHNYFPEEM